jgi:hypothetical protein
MTYNSYFLLKLMFKVFLNYMRTLLREVVERFHYFRMHQLKM